MNRLTEGNNRLRWKRGIIEIGNDRALNVLVRFHLRNQSLVGVINILDIKKRRNVYAFDLRPLP